VVGLGRIELQKHVESQSGAGEVPAVASEKLSMIKSENQDSIVKIGFWSLWRANAHFIQQAENIMGTHLR
jgi:hypothetical protein